MLSKFIPKTKSEITDDILYTMDINCIEKSFRDINIATYQENSLLKEDGDFNDPKGDKLITGVINQVCNFEAKKDLIF